MPVVRVHILSVTPSDLKKQKPAHLGYERVGAGAAVQTVPVSSSDRLSQVPGVWGINKIC